LPWRRSIIRSLYLVESWVWDCHVSRRAMVLDLVSKFHQISNGSLSADCHKHRRTYLSHIHTTSQQADADVQRCSSLPQSQRLVVSKGCQGLSWDRKLTCIWNMTSKKIVVDATKEAHSSHHSLWRETTSTERAITPSAVLCHSAAEHNNSEPQSLRLLSAGLKGSCYANIVG